MSSGAVLVGVKERDAKPRLWVDAHASQLSWPPFGVISCPTLTSLSIIPVSITSDSAPPRQGVGSSDGTS